RPTYATTSGDVLPRSPTSCAIDPSPDRATPAEKELSSDLIAARSRAHRGVDSVSGGRARGLPRRMARRVWTSPRGARVSELRDRARGARARRPERSGRATYTRRVAFRARPAHLSR